MSPLFAFILRVGGFRENFCDRIKNGSVLTKSFLLTAYLTLTVGEDYYIIMM